MTMAASFTLPDTLPVMTLKQVVLFPHAVVPLYIFEDRYREMLRSVLGGSCLFALANETESPDIDFQSLEEAPARIATVGLVRASHLNENGTSHLVLQGLMRVRLKAILTEHPYRMASVEALDELPPANPVATQVLRERIGAFIQNEDSLRNDVPEEFLDCLLDAEDLGCFADLTASIVSLSAEHKQSLLETLDIHERLRLLLETLERGKSLQALDHTLQELAQPDDIERN